jgi:hypothetical protein
MPLATCATFRSELPWLNLVAAKDVRMDLVPNIDWQTQEGRLRLWICASGDTARLSIEGSAVQAWTTNRIAAVAVHAILRC